MLTKYDVLNRQQNDPIGLDGLQSLNFYAVFDHGIAIQIKNHESKKVVVPVLGRNARRSSIKPLPPFSGNSSRLEIGCDLPPFNT